MTDTPGNGGTADHGGDDIKRTALGYNEEERKLRALAGQWKTPPMPAYGSFSASASAGYAAVSTSTTQAQPQQLMQQQQQQHAPPTTTTSNNNTGGSGMMTTSLPAPANLPDNSEEYAKALQEAYRKGAEAAARMAQQQIPTAASCPDFSTGSSQHHSQIRSPATANYGISPVDERTATTTPTPPYQLDHQIHPPPQQHQMNMNQETTVPVSFAVPDPLSSSMPPPPPPAAAAAAAAAQQIHHPPQTQITYAPRPPPEQTFLQPQQSQHQQQQQYPINTQHQQQPQHTTNAPHHLAVAPGPQPVVATATTKSSAAGQPVAGHPPPFEASSMSMSTSKQSQQPGRSLSMPDMSAYAAEAEEGKRLKRLARNRASARLRRLRKKNLVDAYETEVGILEKTLKQLEAHEWGKDTDDHKALLDALGMERGQQAISPEERTTIIQDILKQQMQQVDMLQQAQREQEVLAMLASAPKGEDETKYGSNDDEDNEMFRELQEILQLSDDQKGKLRESSKGLDKEVEALETVSASLEAMQKNDWLLNEGVQKITDQFTSILHKNQQSKLLLWTDANADAVDQLDHVQVQPLQSAPIFSFGVESTTPGDDE